MAPHALAETVRREDGPADEGALEAGTHLFLVLECARPSAGGARHGLDGVDEVVLGRGTAREASREGRRLVLRIPDPQMSASHARITRTQGGWVAADSGSTNGTRVDGRKLAEPAPLADGELLELGNTLFTVRFEMPTPKSAAADVDSGALLGKENGLATLVPAYAGALAALQKVMRSGLPVLLLGESGTGKEVLARAVHRHSLRLGAFVPVNCGAIPETLVESQLFGHTKGAFSGALKDEPGFVRAADRGTLFLDEVGDLPRTSQAALLRVLQEQEVVSVGTTKAVKVDLRVVSATHRRVDDLSSEGFRHDLYARLAGFTHVLPPLRERKEDLGLLIGELLGRIEPSRSLCLGVELGRALFHHDWPLNVRELSHCLSAASVFATEGSLELSHAPESVRAAATRPTPASKGPAAAPGERPLGDEESAIKSALVAALVEHEGNVSRVARALGRTRMQIHRWMRRYGIDPEEHRKKA